MTQQRRAALAVLCPVCGKSTKPDTFRCLVYRGDRSLTVGIEVWWCGRPLCSRVSVHRESRELVPWTDAFEFELEQAWIRVYNQPLPPAVTRQEPPDPETPASS